MEDRQLPGFLIPSLALLAIVLFGLVVLVAVRFGVVAVAMVVGVGLYAIVAHVALPLWVYTDARRHGRAATAWAAATFFVPVVVAPVYVFLARRGDRVTVVEKN